MKRMLACMLLLVFAAAALTGCTAANADPKPTKAPFSGHIDPKTLAPEKPNEGLALGAVLFWETFRYGGDAGEKFSYKIYSDSKEFMKDFGDRGEEFSTRYSENAFNDYFIAAVCITVPTGGYSYSVNSGAVKGNSIKLDILQTSPEPGSMTTQAFERHCILAAFPAELYTEGMTLTAVVNGKVMQNVGDAM